MTRRIHFLEMIMSVEEISKRTRSIAKAADRAVPLGININIMYQSLFACIFFMALFSLKPFADFISNLIVRNEKLDFLALRIFDVALLQGASILVVAFAGFVSIKRSGATWTSDSRRIIYPVLVIFAVLFFELLVEKFVLKPTFSFNRPGDSIGEPWLTEALRQIHGSDDDTGTSTPSGFVVRQTILALMFTFIIHQPNFFSSSRYIKLAIFDLLNISTLFFIGALRLYTGAHRLYDIAIGIGLGGFLFWVMTFLFMSFKQEVRRHIGDFALPTLTFAFMILLYSQDFLRWISFCAITIILMSVLYHPFSGVVPSTHKKARLR